MICFKQLKFDYSFSVSKNLAPIRVQKAVTSYDRKEWVYITDEKVGSKIRLLSFAAGTNDPTSTLHTDKNNKILSLIKMNDTTFVTIDDSFIVR